MLGWIEKVKSLNTVKIQTCFPEFLNVATNVSLISNPSNKNYKNYPPIFIKWYLSVFLRKV